MGKKNGITDNILDFNLSSREEICLELGRRLKVQRLSKKLKQQDLAEMAGVSVGTIKNLESKGQSSLDSLVRITTALDLIQELSFLFQIKIQSIAQMEELDHLLSPKIPRRVR